MASQGRVLLFLFRLLGGGIGALLLVRHREGLDDLVEMGQLPVLAREVRVGVAPVNPRFFHYLVVLPAHLLRVQVFAREDGVILDHLIELQGRGGAGEGGRAEEGQGRGESPSNSIKQNICWLTISNLPAFSPWGTRRCRATPRSRKEAGLLLVPARVAGRFHWNFGFAHGAVARMGSGV